MNRDATSDGTIDGTMKATPEGMRYGQHLAEELLGVGASCSILLVDADGMHAKVGGAPSLPPHFSARVNGLPIGPRSGSCGTAMYERRLVVVDDIETDPLWADYREPALSVGLRACWSVPFENDAGVVLGAFAVYYRTTRRPSLEEEAMLRDIGNSVGLAVHQDAIAQRLAHSEEHHRLVVDHLREGIVVQSRSGLVLACNPSAQRMLRATPQIVGRSIDTVMTRVFREDGTLLTQAERPTTVVLASGKPLLGVT